MTPRTLSTTFTSFTTLVAVWVGMGAILSAQTAFERAIQYAEQISSLNEKTDFQHDAFRMLLKQSAGIRNALLEAMQDAQSIQIAGAQQEVIAALRKVQALSLSPAYAKEADRPMQNRVYCFSLGEYVIEASHLSQLYSAQLFTNQRHQKLFRELDRLDGEILENATDVKKGAIINGLEGAILIGGRIVSTKAPKSTQGFCANCVSFGLLLQVANQC